VWADVSQWGTHKYKGRKLGRDALPFRERKSNDMEITREFSDDREKKEIGNQDNLHK